MKQLIIGVCGYAGAGKDTFAERAMTFLESKAGGHQEVMTTSFAAPMRRMLSALGVPDEYMYDRDLKEKPVPGLGRSYRQLAQTLGTEWGRVCHGEDFWVNALGAWVKHQHDAGVDVFLIPDVRFPNEAEWLKNNGGYLVRVIRPYAVPVNPHESESHVSSFRPWVDVVNAWSLDRFRVVTEGVVQDILRHHLAKETA